MSILKTSLRLLDAGDAEEAKWNASPKRRNTMILSCYDENEKSCHGNGNGRWLVRLSSWIAPGAIFLLMPKCPICFATYLALATGVVVSFGTAAAVRTGLLIICAAWVSYLAMRASGRLWWKQRPILSPAGFQAIDSSDSKNEE